MNNEYFNNKFKSSQRSESFELKLTLYVFDGKSIPRKPMTKRFNIFVKNIGYRWHLFCRSYRTGMFPDTLESIKVQSVLKKETITVIETIAIFHFINS